MELSKSERYTCFVGAIPTFQFVISFTTVCDVVSLQSGMIDAINATNEVKGAADTVCYRNQAKWR